MKNYLSLNLYYNDSNQEVSAVTTISNQSFLAALENTVIQNLMDGLLLVLDTKVRIVCFNRTADVSANLLQK
jgi:hypothetical protein